MREKKELIKRYSFFIIGIWCNALGVAYITRAMLGTGPSTSIPYVASLRFNASMGECNFVFNILLLLLQIILLRKNFNKRQLLQIPVTFLYSAFIDIAMNMCDGIRTDYYFAALFFTLLGCAFRALGVSCQVIADVVMLAPEATVKAISDVSGREFSTIKVLGDVAMTLIAVIMSVMMLGRVVGVREGTFITVLLVGPISHFFTRRLNFTNHYLENDGEFVYETKFKIKEGKRIIVTITSEAGSGGRVIARLLGEKLGIPVYNKELIELVAIESGFSREYVKRHDERLYSNAIERFFLENYNLTEDEMESYRKLFDAQRNVIMRLASEQDCIIVGHCSNYILDDYQGALHFHVSADPINRIQYMMDKYEEDENDAYERIMRQDQDAYQYYMHFTGKDWKDSSGYHMAINSSLFGYEGTAEIIEKAVKRDYIDMSAVKIKDVIKKYKL